MTGGIDSYLSHGVHRSHTQLVGEIIALPQTDTVLALYQSNIISKGIQRRALSMSARKGW